MRLQLHAIPLLAGLSLAPMCSAATPAPNEENCRTAISQGLDMLRRLPPGHTPRDESDRQHLLAEMERLVEASRREGHSECQIWTKMMGKAFNQ